MKVLVTGGAGYIGSHAVKELLQAGHSVVVLDDLSNGHRSAVDQRARFVRGNTGDRSLVSDLLRLENVDAVMHFAANIEVAESVVNPIKYYQNNFVNSLQLLTAMKDVGVKKIIFSSTAAVYGNTQINPIAEDQVTQPINPYGRSKLMTEMLIKDFSQAYGFGYTILRYFNVAGAHPDGTLGEAHDPETHLIPRILLAALDTEQSVNLFGTDYPTPDGTCVRDYVHVVDLVRAHILALEKVQEGRGETYNIGSEHGFSVKQVIDSARKITQKQICVVEQQRRPGDPAVLVASSKKINSQLGWQRQYPSLDTIIQHAWRWHSRNNLDKASISISA